MIKRTVRRFAPKIMAKKETTISAAPPKPKVTIRKRQPKRTIIFKKK